MMATQSGNKAFGRSETETDSSDNYSTTKQPQNHTREDNANGIRTDGDDRVTMDQLRSIASQVWDTVQEETALRRQNLAMQRLREKRDKVVNEAWRTQPNSTKQHFVSNRLAASQNQNLWASDSRGRKQTSFMLPQSGERKKTTVPTIRLDTEKAQARHNTPMTISYLRSAPDKKELDFVPYFRDVGDDDEHEDDLQSLYTTKNREKRLVRGSSYREEDTNADIDSALNRLCSKFWAPDSHGRFQETRLQAIRQPLAYAVWKETGIDYDWLQERYEVLLEKSRSESNSGTKQQATHAETDYENFRELFCNRCFIYSCDIHGLAIKPSVQLQYEKGRRRMKGDFWQHVGFEPSELCLASEKPLLVDTSDKAQELSDSQKELCKKMFYIFEGDASKISAALKVPVTLVSDWIALSKIKLPQCRIYKGAKGAEPPTKGKYHSMRNYKAKWLNRIVRAKDHPWCEPCTHDEPCSEENCSCLQGAFFCTKNCGHAENSRNFFRGCDCKAACKQSSCSCFAANRECDPDLCKACGACTDPPGFHESPQQNCRNDSISMRRHRRLLVGKSTIPNAGWGLFTKHALRKGDFIHEYMGELVSSDEAERRGLLYDKHGCTYLFEQSADYVIDGMDKANKVRFANHSVAPNVEARKMFVNGDVRIGYFAYQNIKAQAEVSEMILCGCEVGGAINPRLFLTFLSGCWFVSTV